MQRYGVFGGAQAIHKIKKPTGLFVGFLFNFINLSLLVLARFHCLGFRLREGNIPARWVLFFI